MVSFDWTSRWGFLLIPAICIFGFITNFVNIIVLLNPKMKDISFKYILATSISDLIYLILESYSFFVLCSDCILHNIYFTKFYDFIIFHYIIPCLAVFCILTDITLSLIRYSILKNKTYIQSFRYYLVISFLFLFALVFYVPQLFLYKIISVNQTNSNNTILSNNEYSVIKNSLGLSSYGKIIPIILTSLRIALAIFVLTGINILNIIEFKKRYSSFTHTSNIFL